MNIDTKDGTTIIPNGLKLSTDLKLETFRAWDIEIEKIENPGTPWYSHHFRDGCFENYPLEFVVCFYENPTTHNNMLTDFSISTSSRIDKKSDSDETWSLENYIENLKLNKQLVRNLLGDPHKIIKNYDDCGIPNFRSYLFYQFKWGQVWCGMQDPKHSWVYADISIRYNVNYQLAVKDYDAYRKRKNPKKKKSWFW
ncbi:hypothetical protein KKF84_13280 [Myxococcota bacterium]|nr:hypothetical protein [Myxococcota bacterium]MBU1536291.1 hypothetical protein [Myxococcota bacterium]